MLKGAGQLCTEQYLVAILEFIRASKINIESVEENTKGIDGLYLIRRKSIRWPSEVFAKKHT